MKWAEFAIKRKYTVFAFVLAVIIFGVFAKNTLKVELFPETNPPLVNVITGYPGVSAEDVARDLSEPLEEEFVTIPGVKKISSNSQDGLSVIKVEFHYGEDVDAKAVDVQNAISKIKRSLPAGIQEPQVMKFSSSDKPVMTISFSSSKVDLTNVRDLAENEIKSRLQLVEGVAAVDVFGAHQRQVNVYVDRDKLNALQIPLDKVIAAIKAQNVTAPGGRITEGPRETAIRFAAEYEHAEEIAGTILDNRNGHLIYLRDVAVIEDSQKEQRSEYRHQGEKKIAIQIIKRDEANTVEVVERVKEELKNIKTAFPYLDVQIADDDSLFTVQVVDNMIESVRDAIIFTALIILIFLIALNESLVVCVSIPLSLLATFALMKMSGMAFNLITLSGIILVIGMVVDDSIIVVENIMRHHQELGKDLYTAAIEGTQEIIVPALAGTMTIVLVMLPLLFIEGFVGRVFGPLAQTVIYAILSSAVMAFTIVPLLTVMLGQRRWEAGEKLLKWLIRPFTIFLDGLKGFYGGMLRLALKARFMTLGLAAVLLVVGLRMLGLIGMDVLPKIDAGSFVVSLQTAPGSSLAQTSAIAAQIEDLLKQEKEVQGVSTQIGYEIGGHYLGDSGALGVGQAYMTVTLSARNERPESVWQIEERLRNKIALIPGIDTFVVKEIGGTAKSTTAAPIDIRISGSDKRILNHLADQVVDKVKTVPGAVNIYKSWSLNTPELNVQVDRERAAELGLSPAAISSEVFKSFEGVYASALKSGGEDTAVAVRYQDSNRQSLEDFLNTSLTSPLGFKVPLREVTEVELVKGSNVVNRENLERTIDVLGYTFERPLSHVTADIEKAISSIEVPEGYQIALTGEKADLAESGASVKLAMISAVVSIYLLLLAQFRSFIHPFTIMLSIPLVIIGVAVALLLSGKTVSLSALLGLILLVGTVVRNGIVLIEYILENRSLGVDREQAILDSVAVRFRPIMMTAFSTVVGMIPLAFEWALGSERFSPLAITVIGGITAATLLTMIVVPVAYSLLDDIGSFFSGKSSAAKHNSQPVA